MTMASLYCRGYASNRWGEDNIPKGSQFSQRLIDYSLLHPAIFNSSFDIFLRGGGKTSLILWRICKYITAFTMPSKTLQWRIRNIGSAGKCKISSTLISIFFLLYHNIFRILCFLASYAYSVLSYVYKYNLNRKEVKKVWYSIEVIINGDMAIHWRI